MTSSKIGGLALAAMITTTTLIAPQSAWSAEQEKREATIIVSGEGETTLAPDMATMTLSVVRQAKTAEEAMKANNEAMVKVLADLKEKGIAERDLQTSDFSVQPQYRQDKASDGSYQAPEIDGYLATNSLAVKVRDLSKLGGLIDASVKLGVNQGGNIVFGNDDPKNAVTEARQKAVAEAAEKAKVLTEAAGVRLGRVIEISENFARPMAQPMYRVAMAKEMAADAVPVASGENSYTVTVNITYALEQ